MEFKVGDIVVTKSRYRTKPEIHNIDLIGEIVLLKYERYTIKIDNTKTPYPIDKVYRMKSYIRLYGCYGCDGSGYAHMLSCPHNDFQGLLEKAKEMKRLLDRFP